MKGNKINGILWLIITLLLTGMLIRGLSGKKLHNKKSWIWHIGPKTKANVEVDFNEYNISSDDTLDEYISSEDFTVYTFDAAEITNMDINSVSEKMFVIASPNQTDIQISISNTIDVRKYFKVYKIGDTVKVERKSTTGVTIHAFNDTEIYVRIPDKTFNSITLNNVSGRIEAENIKARKNEINCVSGKIEMSNCEGKLRSSNVSGKTEITVHELKNTIHAETVSGKLELYLPKSADFSADFETVSGSVKTDFTKTGKKEGTISNGSRTYDLQLETVSGSIEVNAI